MLVALAGCTVIGAPDWSNYLEENKMAKNVENRVTVLRVTRGNASSYGNPSFKFMTERGMFQTQTNTNKAYAVTNDFQLDASLDMAVTLICTPAGRIVDWRLGH